jgi:hypothetical protein
MDVRALPEGAGARQVDLEGAAAHLAQLRVEIAGHVLTDLAEEAQRYVQLLERPPTGAVDSMLPDLQRPADVRRDSEGGEKPDHVDLCSLSMS